MPRWRPVESVYALEEGEGLCLGDLTPDVEVWQSDEPLLAVSWRSYVIQYTLVRVEHGVRVCWVCRWKALTLSLSHYDTHVRSLCDEGTSSHSKQNES